MSDSPVEFGTREYPYKEFESVLIELMNFHTNNNRNIFVNVMEGSVNFVLISNTFISNITSVSFQSYSNTRANPDMVNLEGVDTLPKIIPPGVPSRFNILGK